MVSVYNETGGNVIALEEVPEDETYKYGIIEPGHDSQNRVEIKGLVEKPKKGTAPSRLSVVGRYILQPEVFDHLSAFERGAGNEIQLTDSMAKLIGKQPFTGMRFDGKSYDCGSRTGFIEANLVYGAHDPEIGEHIKAMVKAMAAQL